MENDDIDLVSNDAFMNAIASMQETGQLEPPAEGTQAVQQSEQQVDINAPVTAVAPQAPVVQQQLQDVQFSQPQQQAIGVQEQQEVFVSGDQPQQQATGVQSQTVPYTADQIANLIMQNNQLLAANQHLNQQISLQQMYAQQQQTAVSPQQTVAQQQEILRRLSVTGELKQEDKDFVTQFSPAIESVVKNIINNELLPTFEPVLQQQNQQVLQQQRMVAEANFQSQIGTAFPDFDNFSRSEQFQVFLAQPDPFRAGITMRDHLANAYANLDSENYKLILSRFKAMMGGVVPQTNTAPQAAPSQPQKVPFQTPGTTSVQGKVEQSVNYDGLAKEFEKALADYNSGKITQQQFDEAQIKWLHGLQTQ